MFFGVKGSNFKFHLSNPQKALPWLERRIMTYCGRGVSRDATCGGGEETKKGQKLPCVKLAICSDHPCRRRSLKFCMRGRIRELVIYFSFMKIGRGVSEIWRVENRPLPWTWSMAYTTATACTIVQAVNKKHCRLALYPWSRTRVLFPVNVNYSLNFFVCTRTNTETATAMRFLIIMANTVFCSF